MEQMVYRKKWPELGYESGQNQNLPHTPMMPHMLGNQAMLGQLQDSQGVIQRKLEASVSLIPLQTAENLYPSDGIAIDSMKLQGRSETGLKGQGNHTIADTFVKKYQKEILKERPVSDALDLYSNLMDELRKDVALAGSDYTADRRDKCNEYLDLAQEAGTQMSGQYNSYVWRKILTELIKAYNDAYAYGPFSETGVAGRGSGKGEGTGKAKSKMAKKLQHFDLLGASYILDVNAVEQTGVLDEQYDTYAGVAASEADPITDAMLHSVQINVEAALKYPSYSRILVWLILTHNNQIQAERARLLSQKFQEVFLNTIVSQLAQIKESPVPQMLAVIQSGPWMAAFQNKCIFNGLEFADGIGVKAKECMRGIIAEFNISKPHPMTKLLDIMCCNITNTTDVLISRENKKIIQAGLDTLKQTSPDSLDLLTRRALTMYGSINQAYTTRTRKSFYPQHRRIRVEGGELKRYFEKLPKKLNEELATFSPNMSMNTELPEDSYWESLSKSFIQLSSHLADEQEKKPFTSLDLSALNLTFIISKAYLTGGYLCEDSSDNAMQGRQAAAADLYSNVQQLLNAAWQLCNS